MQLQSKAYSSAAKLAARLISDHKIGGLGGILFGNILLRHGDITGKPCPRKFMDDAASWRDFKIAVAFEYIKLKLFGDGD